MRKITLLMMAALGVLASGCAITDYQGHNLHQSAGKARFWGNETATSITPTSAPFGTPAGSTAGCYSGSYSYLGEYDNRLGAYSVVPHKIFNLRNQGAVTDAGSWPAFSRDGLVDRDGDQIVGKGGRVGAARSKYDFKEKWIVEDNSLAVNFIAPPNKLIINEDGSRPNATHDYRGKCSPTTLVGVTGGGFEEVDEQDESINGGWVLDGGVLDTVDVEQLGDLAEIFYDRFMTGGGENGVFSLGVIEVEMNGEIVPLVQPFRVDILQQGVRGYNAMINLQDQQAVGRQVLGAILESTGDIVAVESLGITLEGGLKLSKPEWLHVAFDHTAINEYLVGTSPVAPAPTRRSDDRRAR